jgi:DNA-binding NarL/FixJ family response regulator
VKAIAALRHSSNAIESIQDALGNTLEIGDFDSFVCAYRAEPQLVEVLASLGKRRGVLIEVLERARDEDLAKRFGLAAPGSRRRRIANPLTRREQEVCGLLAQGLSNKEIATALFITETTAKVHVRHILEKLGARSRTAAAVRASSQGLF